MGHRSKQASIRCLGAVVLTVLFVISVLPAHAQSAIVVTKNEHEHVFKGPMTFRLTAKSSSKITTIKLFYRVSGQTAAHKVVLEFDPQPTVEVEHTEDMNDEENYQPPMITFTYWWVIEDEGDAHLKSEPISFVYLDTRYTWEVLENDQVRLYWHDQEAEFGQTYFEAAANAAAELSAEFGVMSKDPVSIVIYNSHQELMSVLPEASAEWTGAVNFGKSGSIVIGLGPTSWMEKAIPHELTHAMLDQIIKPPFGDIPRWLNEGLALRSEGGMGSEYRAVLTKAIQDDDLISLRVLNSPFPDQRDRATLSYAESYSVVNFIIEEYGSEKLGELISVFAEGAHYDDAMMQIFGVDMDGMEDLWRAHIGAQPRTGVSRATPVPSATMTPGATSTPRSALPQTSKGTNTPVPTPTATKMAAVAAPTPTATQLSQKAPTLTPTPISGAKAPCLGALPALIALILFVTFRPRSVR